MLGSTSSLEMQLVLNRDSVQSVSLVRAVAGLPAFFPLPLRRYGRAFRLQLRIVDSHTLQGGEGGGGFESLDLVFVANRQQDPAECTRVSLLVDLLLNYRYSRS